MPEDVGGDDVGAMPVSTHIFARIHGEPALRIVSVSLVDGGFDEEAVVPDGGKGVPMMYAVMSFNQRLKVASSICFAKPPAERVVRSEERKVAVERGVFGHVGVVARVGPDNARLASSSIHVFKEGKSEEDVVGAEHPDDLALGLLDAKRFRFLAVALADKEDLHSGTGKRLVLERQEKGFDFLLIPGSDWDHQRELHGPLRPFHRRDWRSW